MFCAHSLGSYGLGLICLSVISSIIYHPMKKLAARLQKKENDLQRIMLPQIKRIKSESSGAVRQQRIQRLYRRYRYHPLKALRASLGILFQVPFLIAAYHMIANFEPIEGLSFGPICDLGKPDRLLYGLNLLPVLMTLFNIMAIFTAPSISGKDRRQALIVAFLFLIFLYSAPSALLIYWTANNLFLLVENYLAAYRPKIFNCFNEPWAKVRAAYRFPGLDLKALAVAVSLPCFTFFFYGPVELFLNNSWDLWFNLETTLLTATLGLAWALALFVAIGLLLKGRGRLYYRLFMVGLGLALYIQGTCLQRDYGLLDGRHVDWAAFGTWGVVNALIWVLCLGLPFMIRYFQPTAFTMILKRGVLFLMVVQVATLLFLGQKSQWRQDQLRHYTDPFYLSTKNIHTLSPEGNIIILLFDYLDVNFLCETLETYPELENVFRDFTFFRNTVGMYPFTTTAVPYILTGKEYKNQMPYSEYLFTAFQQSATLNALQQNDYVIDIYTLPVSVNGSASYVTNLDNSTPLKIGDKFLFTLLFYKFTGVKYLPHSFKRYVWFSSEDFESTKSIEIPTEAPPILLMTTSFIKILRKTNYYSTPWPLRKGINFTT